MKIKNKIYSIIKKIYPEKRKIKNLIKNYRDIEKIIYLQTPEHGNLGDQAIAIAGQEYLNFKYKNKLIIEFTFEEYERYKKLIKKLINKEDIIYLHGGGNLGNLYKEIEIQRREIIKTYITNKIIILPQSIFFTNDKFGEKERRVTQVIYNKHKDLHIIARDEKSYKIAKEIFKNNKVYFTPDIVLFLEDIYSNKTKNERKGVIFTLRQDKEKVLSNEKEEKIVKILNKNNIEYKQDDTTVNYSINKETRKYEVEHILAKISSAKINITDRFHGVIFSILTSTPVIVFKSLDHKIVEGIKWFKNYKHIYFIEENINNIEEIEKIILKYVNNNEEKIQDIKKELKEIIKNLEIK